MGCQCEHTKISSVSVAVVGDKVRITTQHATLAEQTKYCLIIAQPCPDAGHHLPVEIVVGSEPPASLQKYGVANIEYGQDLPECRNKIPLYFNNAREFIDLRGCRV